MAKASETVALFAVALCFLSFAYAQEKLIVQGEVYCDTCRVDFKTSLSQVIEGAKVQMECRTVTQSNNVHQRGRADKAGKYKMEVEGNHNDDICEVTVVKSPREDCNELVDDRERVYLTDERRRSEGSLYQPSWGLEEGSPPECAKVLNEMGFVPLT